MIAIYAVFAFAATGRSSVQLLTKFDQAPVSYLLSAGAALIYIAATLGLARSTAAGRRVARAAIGVEMVGVVAVGAASVVRPDWFTDDTVWSGFGAGYGYVPLVLPMAGLAWLVHTRRER